MKTYSSTFRAKLIAMAALLLLMLQVQTVLACEMMESPEPDAECCCDHMSKGADPEDEDCCGYDAQVSFKTSLDDHQVALTAAHLNLELPQLAPPPTYQWPQILAPPVSAAHLPFTHRNSHSSSRTWLATLRLRI
ncbi:hypothetical protein MO867_15075 [Microbulbifer sp. OS29]|uniref:Secreted protein n=1 Tax=Microbulbifer okhotskensis TaxID=2926617 RepID=A0A9X2EU83_9GAMM|nr:hypothetical protein [Microbulbifer okhotskensis]MCO1335658.1 hypothetical protein [Microbulbifer okhotskensis]